MFGRIGDTFALVAIGIYCLVIKVVITSLGMTNFAIVFAALGVLCFALAVDFAFNNPVLRRLARQTKKMTEEQLERVVERLEGQCQISISDALAEEGLPLEGNEDRVAERVFECTRCGWTQSTDELNIHDDEAVCEQCTEEIEEE